MPLANTPDMLVVQDGHPSSAAVLQMAQSYAREPFLLTGWEADADAPEGAVRDSAAAEPTVAEALRTAAQKRISWIGMRRDMLPPAELLRELLKAAAHNRDADIPGFAVLLADGEPAPVRRILGIVDRRGGPISGLLAYFAVALAVRSQAALDILIIGSEDEELSTEASTDLLTINREADLFEAAVAAVRESDINATFMTTTDDPWAVVRDLLGQGEYDLIVDDLGEVSLGRGRVARSLDGALAPGEVGDLPLRVLTETTVPVMLVIDEIRLGMAPAALVKAGAAAAVSLGVATTTLLPAGGAVAHSVAAPSDSAVDNLVKSLQGETDTGTGAARASRADDATTASRSSSRTTAASEKEVTAPKGGATPTQVAKAKKAAAASKASLASAKAEKAAAEKALAKAEKKLAKAEKAAAEAAEAIETTQAESESAQAAAETAASETSGLMGFLPGGTTEEEAQAAAAEAETALAEYLEAVNAGGQALVGLATAQTTVADGEISVASAADEVTEAKAEYRADQAKAEVYAESLADSRTSPVKKGSYRLTARYGQAGSLWSSGIHTGLDFAGSSGTNILAAASGTVIEVGYSGAYGNRIVVDHGNGYKTTYNHMSGTLVSVGTKVVAGEHIGEMGSTGNSTGTHLHFEVLHNDQFMDPETWLGW